jgi:hypothetical protein
MTPAVWCGGDAHGMEERLWCCGSTRERGAVARGAPSAGARRWHAWQRARGSYDSGEGAAALENLVSWRLGWRSGDGGGGLKGKTKKTRSERTVKKA